MAGNRQEQKPLSAQLDLSKASTKSRRTASNAGYVPPTLNREDAFHSDKKGPNALRRPTTSANHTPPTLNRENTSFREAKKGDFDNTLTLTNALCGVKNERGSKAHRRPASGANQNPPSLNREDAFREDGKGSHIEEPAVKSRPPVFPSSSSIGKKIYLRK